MVSTFKKLCLLWKRAQAYTQRYFQYKVLIVKKFREAHNTQHPNILCVSPFSLTVLGFGAGLD